MMWALEETPSQSDQFSRISRAIAELGNMKLHLCDYHLEAGRLCQAQGKTDAAGEHFREAKKLIDETGYFRRKKELKIINYKL